MGWAWTVIVPALSLAGLLVATERGLLRVSFAASAVITLVAVVLMMTGDLERALLFSLLLVLAIIGASKVKFHHSARALIVADFPLAFAGTVPFFFSQYRRMMVGLCTAAVGLCIAAVAVFVSSGGSVVLATDRVMVLVGGMLLCAVLYALNGRAASFRRSVVQPFGYVSTFAASLVDIRAWWPSRRLALIDPSAVALPLLPPVTARRALRPDILVIQHESVFDPRLFGLAVEADIAAFLSPPGGLSGALDVEIFGGGSWQSEFSFITGIASSAFGNDAYFLFKKGVGRFRHALPGQLSALGYRTTLASSCRRGFLNYDAFYGGIGIEQRVFSDDFPAPFDVVAFEQTHSDALFFPAMQRAFADAVQREPAAPHFVYALSNFNHGPHEVQRASKSAAGDRRAFAISTLGDAEYAEYYARLAETASAWAITKAQMADQRQGRPLLVLHYGDHQPVMTRRIEAALNLPTDPQRAFRTFFAVETVGFEACPIEGPIAIADLGTQLLSAAGLPLDDIAATRASLMGLRARERDANRNALLRTMLDRKLIDLES